MSHSAASVDIRPPSDSDFNSSAQNGNPNYDGFSFNSGVSSNYCPVDKINQSSSFSGSGRVCPRTKPRLVKQRRSCKTTAAATLSGDAGINPFQSVFSSNTDHLNGFSTGNDYNCKSNNNVSFVFGVSNSNNSRGSDCDISNCYKNKENDVHVFASQFNNSGFVFGGPTSNDRDSDFDSKNNNKIKENGVNVFGSQFKNPCFVFGGPNLNNKGDYCNIINNNNVTEAAAEGSNIEDDTGNDDSMNNVSLEKEGFKFTAKVREIRSNVVKWENVEVKGMPFCFGAAGSDQVDVGYGKHGVNDAEFGLSEELNKLKIERDEQVSFGGENVEGKNNEGVPSGGDHFVFTSAINSEGDHKSRVNAEETSGLGSCFSNDNVFVFGSSRNPTSDGGSISQSSSFSAKFDGGSLKDVLQSLLSSSALGAEGGSGKAKTSFISEVNKAGRSFGDVPQSSAASFPEFKLPEFDSPLTFSSNLPSESGRKSETSVRRQGLRDKHSKKMKAKKKHSTSTRQQAVEIPVSSKSVVQTQEETECGSPMDFSPYQETTTTNEVSKNDHKVTGQLNVESGTLFGVYAEAQPNKLFVNNELGATKADPISRHDNNGSQFGRNSDVASEGREKFAFDTPSSTHKDVSSHKCHQKKKYRMKSASVTGTTLKTGGSSLGGTPTFNKLDGLSGNSSVYMSTRKDEAKGNQQQGRESNYNSAEKACDKWRRRGNEAYEKGDLSQAENLYTLGVNCIPPRDAWHVVFTPLVRCYSNRAATRMALGRVREAVQDCLMAVKLDPTFHRAQMRAANCYLQLGELENAMKCFGNIIESSNAVCLDRQVVVSASEGIRKSQKVIDCISRSAELLRLKTSEATASALDLIAEAMSKSIYSEKLLQMKAEALCMLRRHDEAIALCHQTHGFAEKNFTGASSGNDGEDNCCLGIQRWRQRALYKCHFHLGKLEMALDYMEKDESGAKTQEASDPLAVTIGELLREKNAGNSAFQSGKHIEAIEHYTTAILSSMESRPFAAICFCNRAAAHQALGRIADAISDCSLAIALDENYAKAVSRRATLHELIRDYRQATVDLEKLISLHEKQSAEKSKQSGSGNGKELRQIRNRLSMMEEAAKRDTPLDLYLILGVNKSDPASEIKKAYRKAALRHHPDKACQSLVRSEGGDEVRHWKDIADLVHKDSDRLFKMIGEAYAVLSDPTKREEYDEEEVMRKAPKERNNMRNASRRHSEHYYQGFSSERSNNRRYWQDSFRAYSNSYNKW